MATNAKTNCAPVLDIVKKDELKFVIMDAPTNRNIDLYLKELEKHKVKTIVRVCERTYSQEKCKEQGFEVQYCPYPDDVAAPPQKTLQAWLNIVQEEKQNGRGIAVHCLDGYQRAPLLVAIALMTYANMRPTEAYQFVRKTRRSAINRKQFETLTTLSDKDLEEELVGMAIQRSLESAAFEYDKESVPQPPSEVHQAFGARPESATGPDPNIDAAPPQSSGNVMEIIIQTLLANPPLLQRILLAIKFIRPREYEAITEGFSGVDMSPHETLSCFAALLAEPEVLQYIAANLLLSQEAQAIGNNWPRPNFSAASNANTNVNEHSPNGTPNANANAGPVQANANAHAESNMEVEEKNDAPDNSNEPSAGATLPVDIPSTASMNLKESDDFGGTDIGFADSISATSMDWMANIDDVSPEEPMKFVRNNRAFKANVDVGTDALIVDLKQLCPDLNVVTFQHLLNQYILARTSKKAKPFLLLMASELNICDKQVDKALLLKIEKFRKKHWKRIKNEMKANQQKLMEEANLKFRRDRAIFDEPWEFQRAVIYFLDHDCNVEYHKSILNMKQKDVIKKLESYSKEALNRAQAKRKDILIKWTQPRLSGNFQGWDPKQINGVICGKSGNGKSSLINIIGAHLGKDFKSHVDIVECTKIATRFPVHSNLVLWDTPGHSTGNVEEGKEGSAYIREYCLTYFDFVVIVNAARTTKFAADLYKQLKALNKQVFVVRTKVDQDIANTRTFHPNKTLETLFDEIKDNMKHDIGANDSEIFLCAGVPMYFETAKLCSSILLHSIKAECPDISEEKLNKIGGLHKKGMTDLLLIARFDLTRAQLSHILEYYSLDETLWNSHAKYVEEEKKNKEAKEEESDEDDDSESDNIFDDPDFAAIFPNGDGESDEDYDSEEKSDNDDLKHVNVNAISLDAVLDIDEEDQIVNHVRILVEENLPHSKPFTDDATNTLQDLRHKILGEFSFSKRLKNIETIFSDKQNEIAKYMERKEQLKKQFEKEIAEKLNVNAFSDVEGMLEKALNECRHKIEAEATRILLKEHNERLLKEEKYFQWLLREADVLSKQAFIFAMQYSCDPSKIEIVKSIAETALNEKLRQLLDAKRTCMKTRELAADHFGIHHLEMTFEKLMDYFKIKMPYFRKMWKFPLPADFQNWKEQKRIAVIGAAGTGKSTIVRTILSRVGNKKFNSYKGKEVHDIPVKIDVVEATLEPQNYPLQEDVILTDFPGSGTVRIGQGVKGEDYIRKYHILHHHVIIITTCARFHETEIEIARICIENNVKFLFVRTKFDCDIQSADRTDGAVENVRDFMQSVCKKLKDKFHDCLAVDYADEDEIKTIKKVPLFFINGKRHNRFHFPELIKTVEVFLKNTDELLDLDFGEWKFNCSADEVFFCLIDAKGWHYREFVKELYSWGATLLDLMKFNKKDFEMLGLGKSRNAIRKGVVRLINAHKNESAIEGKSVHTAIQKSIESVVEQNVSMSRIVNVIFEYIEYYENIRVLTPIEVSTKLSSCHKVFKDYAVQLQIDGDTLLRSSNDDILSLMDAKEFNTKPTLKVILNTKLDNIRWYEEEDIVEEMSHTTKASLLTTEYLDDNKLACVLVVTKDRDVMGAIKEAADLEKAFARTSYSILSYGDRENAMQPPVTATSANFYEVAKHIEAHKEQLDGCFIFILTHGYTKKDGDNDPKPMICTEDGEIDVFEYLQLFEEYDFPCIFAINACRVPQDSSRAEDFDIPYWTEFEPQLFVSWGATKGKEAFEGKFVQFWRKELLDVTFNEENISSVAGRVKSESSRWGGGVYHDGLNSEWECKRGIFIKGD